jgi:hypothetical protein
MAVTRINNNQITDASAGNVYLGINANTKLQNFSITSQKIANNLTYGSDLTVSGNLTVNGTSTAIDTTITTIEDPVIVLASTQTGSPTVDIGFIGERGTSNNIAFVWDESSSEFVTAFTDTSETNTTINIIGYADIHTKDANIGGNAVINGTTSLVGNLVGDVNATANVTGGNLLTAGLVSATGNVTGGNVLSSGLISATATITGGNLATGGTVSATATITGGNLATGGTVSATATITGGNVATGGTVSATGNITGDYFIGNGSQLTGVTASSVDANNLTGTTLASSVVNSSLTSVGSLTNLSVVGTTQTGNLQTAGFISATGTVTGGNVATGGNVSATGEITGGNVFTGGLISATGDITGGSLTTSGTANVTQTITGGNIQSNGFLSAVGTATVGNLATGGTVSSTGTITGGNIATGGTVSSTGTVTGGNIATGGTVSSTGTITGGNIDTGGQISATGNITGGNVNAPQVYGSSTLTLRAGTGNINLETVGNVVVNNTYINGLSQPVQNQDAATKLYVDNLVTTSISYHEAVVAATNTTLATATGGTITYAQPNGAANGVGATLTTTGSFTTIDTANVQTVGTRILVKDQANAVQNGVYVYSNATVITRASTEDTYGAASANTFSINDYFFVSSGSVNAGSAWIVDAPAGTITFGTSNIQFAQFSSSQVYSANTSAGLSLTGTVFSAKVDNNTTAFDGLGNISVKAGANLTTPNIGDATGTSLSTTGTITGGNLATGGTVSATATITGGNLATGGTASAGGTITGGNLDTGGTVSATGTATVGNLATGGTVSATGEVTGANIITGGLITSTGNITGGNVLTGGLISSAGTVTGGNIATGGTASVTGTITGGNIDTGGTVSATGNVTGGNVTTGGQVSATGNITGGNILSGGSGSFTGNVTAANFIGNISGNISAPGANTQVEFNDNGVTNATAGFTFNKTSNTVTVGGQITSTGTGNADTGGGQIFLNGATLNRIDYNTNGTGAPALTTRSAGTKVTLYPALSASTADYAIGIDTATMWSSVPENTAGFYFKWYGATTEVANISGTGVFSAVGNVTGANILTSGYVTATGNVTSANLALTTGFIDGPAAGRITINGSDIDTDFAVNGDTVANVFYVDAATGTASFGSATQTVNAVVAFNSTNSILAPVGNTAQRPATGVTGMVRFNTTNNNLELYNNSAWTAVGVPEFTVITNEQFFGDGVTLAFTLGSTQTTNSCIVSINGVVQIPITAYSVAGTDPTCVLTFTEAPAEGDAIEVRQITTTTSVTSISNASGNAVVAVSDTSATTTITGDLTVTGNATILGNVATNEIQNGSSKVQITDANGNIHFDVNGANDVVNFGQFNSVFSGNILPTANVTYDLGTSTKRWKDLYLANSTIYLGNAQISANATAIIMTNPAGGQTVLSGASPAITGATVSVTGAVTAASVVGGVITGSSTSVTGTTTAASVVGGVITGSSTSVTGTVTGGNITTTGTLTVNSGGAATAIVNGAGNAVGNIGSSSSYFNTVFAKATSAQYADLAEKYTADAEYAPGTVVVFGGTHEVTVDATDADRRVAGVVSTNPSYIMNGGLEGEFVATVALTGRVPTMVYGPVCKGDMMVAAGLGRARAEQDPRVGTVIGKALEDFDGAEGTIEVVVGRF